MREIFLPVNFFFNIKEFHKKQLDERNKAYNSAQNLFLQ
jgi:hypothetical protein